MVQVETKCGPPTRRPDPQRIERRTGPRAAAHITDTKKPPAARLLQPGARGVCVAELIL